MNQREQQLSILSDILINKTVTFYSPLGGVNEVLVRTCASKSNSSFYHSLFYAYSKEYVSKDENGRGVLINKLQESLSKNIDTRRSNIQVEFEKTLNTVIEELYTDAKTKDIIKDKDIETFNLIREMISLGDFRKHILIDCSNYSINICKEKIIYNSQHYYKKVFYNLPEKIDKERVKYYVSKLKNILSDVLDKSEQLVSNNYLNNITINNINIISERLGRDIYVLSKTTRLPVMKPKYKHQKSIIVLNNEDNYEVIGRLLSGNRIQREFSSDDPLISKMYTFLYHPNKIIEKYPHLTSYITNNRKSPVKVNMSSLSNSSLSRSSSRSKSRSPFQSRSPSPVQSRSPSPVQSRSPSPVQSRSPSPVQYRSPSPVQSRHDRPMESRHDRPRESRTRESRHDRPRESRPRESRPRESRHKL
jgi:hypothetical protein